MLRAVIRKVDINQPEIVAAFRRLGYSVQPTHIIGKGFPDLVAGKWGKNYLIEVKNGMSKPSDRKLTADEEEFWKNWKGSIVLIESVDDVIEFDRKHSRGRG